MYEHFVTGILLIIFCSAEIVKQYFLFRQLYEIIDLVNYFFWGGAVIYM